MTLTMSRTTRPLVCTEQELVAATRAGDDRAFEELYARYRERIFSFILSKVHDHGRAEDIAQEVFMSALRRLRGTDQAIAFKPWLYEIAKNACIDEFRRGSRAREVPLESDGEFVVDHQNASLSSVPTPPAAVESRQRLNDLRGAFGGLSASHHQLLVMREFEGLSYDEIGSRLDMTRQMVESGLFRARRKLSEEYEELASGKRCEQIQTAIEDGRLRTVTSLGLRDRRRFARHLSHCQLCRHVALMAGVDEALVRPRSIAAKIAALLPFPVWRLFGRSRGAKAASANGSHVAGAGSAGLAKSAGSAITLGQAAATVAVVIAGAGGGLAVTGLGSGGHARPPALHRSAHQAAATSGSSGSAIAAGAAAAAKAKRGGTSTTAKTAGFSAPRTATRQRGGARKQRGSTPGAPGSGTSSAGSGSSSSPGPAAGAGSTPAGTATKAVNGAAKTVNGAAKTVNGVTSGLGRTVNGVVGGAGNTVNGVVGGAGNTVNGVVGGVGKTVNGVVGGVGNAVNGVTQATGTGTSPVGQAVGNATSGVTQTTSGVTNGVSKTVGGVTSGVSKTVGGVTGGVTGALGGSSSSSPSAPSGSNPPAPATSGATSTVSGATQPVKSGVQQVGSLLGH